MEAEIKQELTTEVHEELQTTNDNISCIETNIKSLEDSQKLFDTANKGNADQIFITAKQTDLTEQERVVEVIQSNEILKSILFQPDPLLQNVLANLNRFGTVNVNRIPGEVTKPVSLRAGTKQGAAVPRKQSKDAQPHLPLNVLPTHLKDKRFVKVVLFVYNNNQYSQNK